MKSTFSNLYDRRVAQRDMGNLYADINWLIECCKITKYSRLESSISSIMELRRNKKEFTSGIRSLLKNGGLETNKRDEPDHVREEVFSRDVE